jgi:hypothetical protein
MTEYELTRDEEKRGSLTEQAIALFLEQLQALTKGEIVSFTVSVSRHDAEEPEQESSFPIHIVVKEQPAMEPEHVRVKVHEPEPAAPQLTHIVVKEQPEPEIVTHHIVMREQSNQD